MEIYNSFQTSVKKALDEIDVNWPTYRGLIICGTHSPHDTEKMISRIKEARESGEPALLICAGHQLGAIEYARNVLGIKDATSEEFGNGTFVVKKRPELKVGLYDGKSWWSNYEVTIDYKFPDYFISVPFHPEYQSSVGNPNSFLIKFLTYAKMAM